MTRTFFSLFAFLFCSIQLGAQHIKSSLHQQPMKAVVNVADANKKVVWSINLQTIVPRPKVFGNQTAIKQRNYARQSERNHSQYTAQQKTLGNAPAVGNSFKGTEVKGFTPPDNSVAIGNDGKIVCVTNQNFEVYDTNGNQLLTQADWNIFLDAGWPDSTYLVRGKFDPRVLFDPYHDRYILCILHEYYDTAQSTVLLSFSETNDPLGNWYCYAISGNPLLNRAWTDYPSMGINAYELFFNANLFGTAADNYAYKGTYIHQIDLDSAYAGGMLQYRTWSNFDITKYITIKPAPSGLMANDYESAMHLVTMNPNEDSLVHLFTITDTMNAPNVAITHQQYKIPYYSVCSDGTIKDPNNPIADTISTGSSWIHNAFILDSTIHFTFSANVNGDCGINLGQIDLATQTATYTTYSEPGNMLAYPAIAPFGYHNQDHNVVMAYLRASDSILPEVCVIAIDENMIWSSPQTIKTGDTIVNILPLPYHERWGDYTGIARKYNATRPEAWLFGCYSANTPPRLNSWGSWIAQLKTNNGALRTEDLTSRKNVTLYPNPTKDIYSLTFEIEKQSKVNIVIYDVNGRKIKTLFDGDMPLSKSQLSFNRNALSSGQYFLQISVEGEAITKKLLIIE